MGATAREGGLMSVAEIFETMAYGPAPESSSEAGRWLDAHRPALGHFIDNRPAPPREGEYIESVNPADGKKLIDVAQGGAADVDMAVAAARDAFESWSRAPGHVRTRHLYALARAVQRHARLLAVLETLDNGKPIRESRDIDIPLVARHFYYHAGWAQLLADEFPGHAPVGVVGAIIPWNFPLLMLAWKVAPALATGNTVVLKPAEYTSLTALLFAELAREAGLPPGVLNVVTGDGRTGELLVAHPGVDKIAFTGSTEVGRAIRRSTAGTGKRLSLELGGKSPFVVCEDADLDSVVEGVVDAIWFNQGQVCCAGSRLLVQEGVEASLLAKLRARMERLRVGDPLDKAIDIGAIVAPVQLQRIRDLVAQGEREGATIWQPSWACPTEGLFYPPTLVTDVAPASTLAQVEVFGPVLAAMTFRTKSEAVALANNTPYGLAASVWSENINTALDIARDIKAGTVWINCSNLFDAASGFGGYRESGFGREGGKEGLYEYLRPAWEVVPHPPTPSPTVRERPAPTSAEPGDQAERSAGAGGEGWPYPPIDRTPKLYVGGKQARPDSGYSRPVLAPDGRAVGEAGEGNRKDIRNAVEAARGATAWAAGTAHARAQVIYYIAENLAARADELAGRLSSMTGAHPEEGRGEVEASIERLFTYAAWADKYDGLVHATPLRGVTLAVNEPIGVMGIACDDRYPLLGLVALVAPAIAMGNTVVVVPSERYPLAATDLYQVLDTSDAPAGVVNIVTGPRDALARVLAEHDDVDAIWYAGSREGARAVEQASAGNLKRAWIVDRPPRDLMDPHQGQGQEFLREATQVKNMWVPSGD
jgi:aldehyde dehydrogenase (NAD+)